LPLSPQNSPVRRRAPCANLTAMTLHHFSIDAQGEDLQKSLSPAMRNACDAFFLQCLPLSGRSIDGISWRWNRAKIFTVRFTDRKCRLKAIDGDRCRNLVRAHAVSTGRKAKCASSHAKGLARRADLNQYEPNSKRVPRDSEAPSHSRPARGRRSLRFATSPLASR